MRRSLHPHPATPANASFGIKAEASRLGDGRLLLRYHVLGAVTRLLLPEPAAPMRTDGLWQHSCFEAFIRLPGEQSYAEFNFSPSGQWAAYRFSRYRQGMEPASAAPMIETRASSECYELSASIRPDLRADAAWHLGLTAVIEERCARKSYWSLGHFMDNPDFHDPAGFLLELPAA